MSNLFKNFTFQYGSTLINVIQDKVVYTLLFTFQYGSTLIGAETYSFSSIVTFTFQYGSTLIRPILSRYFPIIHKYILST